MISRNVYLAAAFAALAAACSSNQPTGSAETPSAENVAANDDAGLWSTVRPKGETACTDGSEFYFLTHEGDADKLLFFLEGGGGCWNKASCDPAGEPTAKLNLEGQAEPGEGIFDFGNPENPFAGYSVVYVPYCSGDVHIGRNDVVYPGADEGDAPLQVFHRGRTNVQSALDWVTENYTSLDEIFVTGVSAGAVPTPFYASILAGDFEGAHVASLGDGAGGYRRTTPMGARLEDWGVFNHITRVAGFEELKPETFNYEKIYTHAAEANPDIVFARFDYSADPAQWRFLSGNTEFDTLLANMLANNDDIRAESPNFRAFLAGGEEHTVMQRNGFYEVVASGTRLVDWVGALVERRPVANVACKTCVR